MSKVCSDIIEVFALGSPVLLGYYEDCNIPATVLAVMIHANNQIQYQCAYWNGRERKLDWLEESEVTLAGESRTTKIGFKR